MKRLHFFLGIILIIVFLLTGQYMEYVHNRVLPDGVRTLYRSRHIYILFSGLINISLGIYFVYLPKGWRRSLQLIGSVLIAIAPVLLLAGFFYEPPRGLEQTKIARYGIYATAAGMLLHLIGGWRKGTEKA